ncbi:MAG: type II toxin-antitoxin system RelB/DinJ family antitoxin [Treponemataceae bacterium]|nr:type II toxin-antitoxin system RelB/DinJ family antitoxin [Treponemataceae bacterium]
MLLGGIVLFVDKMMYGVLHLKARGDKMTAISIRLDDNTKEKFGEFCDEAGLSVSAAITMFIKTVVREKRIPFEIRTTAPVDKSDFYSEENQKWLSEQVRLYNEGKLHFEEHELIRE